MGMQSDAKSTTLSESGVVFGGPARIRGIYFVGGATAGTIEIKDGGASGATLLTLTTPASVESSNYLELSDSPFRCESSAYATLTDVTSVTVIYS